MSHFKFPTRKIELDPAKSTTLSIPIGRSARLPNLSAAALFDASKLSRVENLDNLYFDERTVSKIHAYLKIDYQYFESGGAPCVILEDNGSQHGVVWGEKRIPKNAKIRIRQNDFVGLVDTLNKNESSIASVYDVDPDTVFFTPHSSWKFASVTSCKVVLQFRIITEFDTVGERITYLEVEQWDQTKLSEEHPQEQNDQTSSFATTSFDIDDVDDVDSHKALSDSEELVELVEPLNNVENGTSILEVDSDGSESNQYDDDEDLYDIDGSRDKAQDLFAVDQGESTAFSDEEQEDQAHENSNRLKRKFWEEEDEVEDADDNSNLEFEYQSDSDLDSQSDPETLTDDTSVEPPTKKQKVEDTPNSFNVKSHLVAGFTGLAVGAAMTFATLASLGEGFAENASSI